MLKPKFITFTGVDEKTNPDRVLDLSKRYPVEWGILFSRNKQGKANRYPSINTIGNFLFVMKDVPSVKLSAHICGRYSNDIMTGSGAPIGLRSFLHDHFERTQINVADGETHVDESNVFPGNAMDFAQSIGAKRAIIQCRSLFPNKPQVDWLFDQSGGAGIEPHSWYAGALGSSAFCGYAGGIGPHNVLKVLENIEGHPLDKEFWIDMEGNIRTNDWLDLDKCEAVLRAVYGEGAG